MESLIPIVLILSALLIGAISPGPSFVLIASIAVYSSSRDGIAVSIGMGVGGVMYAILSLFGLHTILSNVPALYLTLKIIGGLYLFYLAFCIWRGAYDSVVVDNDSFENRDSLKKSFLAGLLTQVSNPKTAIVYASIFAALLPADFPVAVFYILPVLVFTVEAGWYFIVALVFSSSAPRSTYLKSKPIFDRIAGAVMFGLGVKLLSNVNTQ